MRFLMGNYRFRLSDMIPNAWFYKLKGMSSSRKQTSNSNKKRQSTSSSTVSAKTAQQPSKSKGKQSHLSQPRKSYYFRRDPISTSERFYSSPTNSKASDTTFPEPPRKSPKKKSITSRSSPKLVTSSVSGGCSCRATVTEYSAPPLDIISFPEPEQSESLQPKLRADLTLAPESFDEMISLSKPCLCSVVDKESLAENLETVDRFIKKSEMGRLPPIIAKPPKFNDMIRDIQKQESRETVKQRRSSAKNEELHESLSIKLVKEEQRITSPCPSLKRISGNSTGFRLRVNSPRIGNKKIIQAFNGRKSVSSNSAWRRSSPISESLAIVKSSSNPHRDFRDSMVEMIVENNINDSKELEELLACYLALNSDEYHDLIIKVFKQIWFDLTDIRTK